jgi:hypothetical protein
VVVCGGDVVFCMEDVVSRQRSGVVENRAGPWAV